MSQVETAGEVEPPTISAPPTASQLEEDVLVDGDASCDVSGGCCESSCGEACPGDCCCCFCCLVPFPKLSFENLEVFGGRVDFVPVESFEKELWPS